MTTGPEMPTLPEYAGNPFIARLPPLQSQREQYQSKRPPTSPSLSF